MDNKVFKVESIESDKEFQEKVTNEKLSHLVVVDFFAKWCGPCKQIAPTIDLCAKQYQDVRFYKVDVENDNCSESSKGVRSFPTFRFYKQGKLLVTVGNDIDGILDAINKYR